MAIKDFKAQDRKIIESALDLWTASILENTYLLKEFYNWTRSEEQAGLIGIRNAKTFVL